MKIALVAQDACVPDRSGSRQDSGRVRLHELARNLARHGHGVTLYVQRPEGRRRRDRMGLPAGVGVEHIGPDADGDERDLLARVPSLTEPLRARLARERPDVVHAVRWTSGLAALAAARGLGIPVVQSFQSLGIDEQRHGVIPRTAGTERIRLEPAIGRSVSAVLAATSDEESDLARLGVPRRAIRVVPCGVDTTEFTPQGPTAARGSRRRLVTVTGLEPGDTVGTLLRTMAGIPRVELVMAGGPPRGDLPGHPEHRRLAALARSLGIADRVRFTGRLSRAAMPSLLRSADLFVSTSGYDPSGLLPLQAMACGTPVVAMAASVEADVVVDGTTGVLIPPGRPALLGRRVRQLLGHPMMLDAFSVAAADRARARYSWDRIARETLDVYHEALAGAAGAEPRESLALYIGPGIAGPGIAGPGIAGPGIAGPGIAGPVIASRAAGCRDAHKRRR